MTTYTAHEILGGLYENTVKMTVSRRLRYMPYAQAGWIDRQMQNGATASDFYSYSSLIFTVYRAAAGMCISTENAKAASNYSRTTSRQVTAALRELGLEPAEVQIVKHQLDAGGKFGLAIGG